MPEVRVDIITKLHDKNGFNKLVSETDKLNSSLGDVAKTAASANEGMKSLSELSGKFTPINMGVVGLEGSGEAASGVEKLATAFDKLDTAAGAVRALAEFGQVVAKYPDLVSGAKQALGDMSKVGEKVKASFEGMKGNFSKAGSGMKSIAVGGISAKVALAGLAAGAAATGLIVVALAGIAVVVAVKIAKAIIQFGKWTVSMSLAADAAKQANKNFLALSGTAANATANMEAMAVATKGTLSQMEAQTIAAKLLGLGVAKSSEEIQKLITGTTRLGKVFRNLGAADAAEEFALLLANMSLLRLDTFGLNADAVRTSMNKLLETTKDLTKADAFRLAVIEEMDAAQKALGKDTLSFTDRIDRITAASKDAKLAWQGIILAFAESDAGIASLDKIVEGIRILELLGNQRAAIVASISQVGISFDITGKALLKYTMGIIQMVNAFNPLSFAINKVNEKLIEMGHAFEELTGVELEFLDNIPKIVTGMEGVEAGWGKVLEAGEELIVNWDELSVAYERNFDKFSDAESEAAALRRKALEDIAKRVAEEERIDGIRREIADRLLDINDELTKDIEDLWNDHYKDLEEIAESGTDKIIDLTADFNKAVFRDTKKQSIKIKRLEEDAKKKAAQKVKAQKKSESNERSRRHIDALADERLFNFDIENLAAEGEGNRIREMIARRAIEQEIAAEKAAAEATIEKDKLDLSAKAEKESSDLRQKRLKEDFALEQQFKLEDFNESIAQEKAANAERIAELIISTNEKQAVLEQSKNDAVAKIAEEMNETGELVQSEMEKLLPMAEKIGLGFGEAFGKGLKESIERQDLLKEFNIGGTTGSSQFESLKKARRQLQGASQGPVQNFGGSGLFVDRSKGGLSVGGGGSSGFATGVSNFAGGTATIGEHGREQLSLPSNVNITANNSITTAGGGVSREEMERMLNGRIATALDGFAADLVEAQTT